MTAEELLAEAKTWKRPGEPARSKIAYRVYIPTINHLVTQNWSARAIKDRIAKRAKLDTKQANRLYYFICRHIRGPRPKKGDSTPKVSQSSAAPTITRRRSRSRPS